MKSLAHYDDYLASLQRRQQLRVPRHVENVTARHIVIDGRRYRNHASNDYLALRDHSILRDGAARWLKNHGTGLGSARLMGASLDALHALEARMASAKGMDYAVIFGNGFSCNGSVLAALLDKSLLPHSAMVYMDRNNHASLYQGVKVAEAKMRRFRHLDYDQLEHDLARDKNQQLCRFIVSDTVFSMDGDCADLTTLRRLAADHDALLVLDDAHGFGVLGDNGYGLAQNMKEAVVTATFGKAYGAYGAVCFCNETIYRLLWQKAGGLIYSTALPPAVLGAIEAAFDHHHQWQKRREKVIAHHRHLRARLDHVMDFPAHETPIVPVIVGENEAALAASDYLYERGFFVPAVRAPTVPPKKARLRVSLSAAHETKDIDALADGLSSWLQKK